MRLMAVSRPKPNGRRMFIFTVIEQSSEKSAPLGNFILIILLLLGLPAHGFLPPAAPTVNPPTLADLTNVHDYNQGLTAARNAAKHGAMPAWCQAWDVADFQPLKRSLDLLHANFAIFRAQCDDPAAALHNLPATHNSDDLIALTPVQGTTYLRSEWIRAIRPGRSRCTPRHLARDLGYFGTL
ncbi:hypothetical protein DFH09DRAFT_1101019 [Mycena vulgaris]|nr:hypothetical protein DFH09DRAFT_1101019 [Mycena vulgaris]